MNEILFFTHILVVIGFLFLALKSGKEALFAFIVLMAIFANLLVLKQIEFFSFTITCSDVFAVGALLGLNLLQEYFGKEEAKKALKISFMALLFFLVMANIHLFYTPSEYDQSQSSYEKIFSPAFRIVCSSFLVFITVQKLDILFFGFLKRVFQGRSLAGRLFISLSLSQLFDTVLFSFLGLYGIVQSLFDIILISFLVKMAIIFLSSPLTSLSKRWIKVSDG